MASAFTHTIQTDLVARTPLGSISGGATPGVFMLPDLLSCAVISWSEQRSQMLQSVAVDESWQAKVCGDVQEFLRSLFQLDLPLTIVDLPDRGTASYAELREMAAQASGLNRSLLVVCGAIGDHEEEQWARQLGVWAYLPGVTDPSGLSLVFAEARKALAKQSSASSAYLATG